LTDRICRFFFIIPIIPEQKVRAEGGANIWYKPYTCAKQEETCHLQFSGKQ